MRAQKRAPGWLLTLSDDVCVSVPGGIQAPHGWVSDDSMEKGNSTNPYASRRSNAPFIAHPVPLTGTGPDGFVAIEPPLSSSRGLGGRETTW